MTSTSKIPVAILDLLSRAAGIPAGVEFIERKEKSIENDIEASLAKLGACMFVMPVKMLEVQEGADLLRVRFDNFSNASPLGVAIMRSNESPSALAIAEALAAKAEARIKARKQK